MTKTRRRELAIIVAANAILEHVDGHMLAMGNGTHAVELRIPLREARCLVEAYAQQRGLPGVGLIQMRLSVDRLDAALKAYRTLQREASMQLEDATNELT